MSGRRSEQSLASYGLQAGVVLQFCSAACTAASIGTLVNSESTSKDTVISLSKIVSLLMLDTYSK